MLVGPSWCQEWEMEDIASKWNRQDKSCVSMWMKEGVAKHTMEYEGRGRTILAIPHEGTRCLFTTCLV